MKLAVFGDVHGDTRALEAVLRDAKSRGVEGMVHLGDLAGNGEDSAAVVACIRREAVPGVAGDWDLRVCEAAGASPGGGLDDESRAFLRELPAQILIAEGRTRLLFTHASPERPDEPALPEAADEVLQNLLERCGADVLVVGHTHRATARQIGNGLLLNPGSVGRPGDGDPRPSYLILDTTSGVQALRVRVELDVERPVSESVIS